MSGADRMNSQACVEARLLLRGRVTCPRCWTSYAPESTLWISNDHPMLNGDSRLGDVARRFRADRFTATGAAIDASGAPCSRLACPACHLEVPRVFYTTRPYFVSVFASTDVCARVFVAAMVRSLRASMPKSFGMALLDADIRLNRPLHVMEQALAANSRDADRVEELLSAVQCAPLSDVVSLASGDSVSLQRPFVFRADPLRVTDVQAGGDAARAVSVNIGLRSDATTSSSVRGDLLETAHLGVSDLHVFVYDPMRDRAGSHGPGKVLSADHAVPQHVVLQAAADMSRLLRERRPRRPQQCPLVIAVMRLEDWEDHLPIGLALSITSALHSDARDHGMQAIEEASREVRAYLTRTAPELVTVAEHAWSDVTFIPASISGTLSEGARRDEPLVAPQVVAEATCGPPQWRPLGCDLPMLVGLARASASLRVEAVGDDGPFLDGGQQ